MLRSFFAMAFLLVLCGSAASQIPQTAQELEVESIFERGIILYNNGKYSDAYRTFSQILKPGQSHRLMSAALLMRAKTALAGNRLQASENDILRLDQEFPSTRYRPYARHVSALLAYQHQDYIKASRHLLWLVDSANDERLRKQAIKSSQILLRDYLSLPALRVVFNEKHGRNASALKTVIVVRRYLNNGDPGQAGDVIENYLAQYPDSPVKKRLLSLLENGDFTISNVRKLGVILPLSSGHSEEAKALFRGIKYAEKIFRRTNKNANLEIVVRDSENSMIKAVNEFRKLQQDPKVLGVIGGMDEFIAAGLAGMAESARIPFIAPAATDNGLASIGSHIFQAIPDLETQATKMARYAIDSLRLRTFVSVAPQDEYGRMMVDAFSAEIDRLGGEIMMQQWYYDVPENMGRQFKQIREMSFKRQMEDTLRLSIPDLAMLDKDSLWKDLNARVMLENNLRESIVDLQGHFPVTNIDGVFLPIYNEDIKYIPRQLVYQNIRAQFLGSEKWYQLDLGKERELGRYIEGAIFASSYFIDNDSFAYRSFRDEFRKEFGTSPGKWDFLGYDAAIMFLKAYQGSVKTRSQLLERLTANTNVRGIKGNINFDETKRVNQNVEFVQISGKNYKRHIPVPVTVEPDTTDMFEN